MNGLHARGCGISIHDRNSTITKKTANSIVGKITGVQGAAGTGWPAARRAFWRSAGSSLQGDVRMVRAEVLVEGVADATALLEAGHSVAPEQLLLRVDRQAGDLPAHCEALEQQLAAALPAVLRGGAGLRVEPFERLQRAGAQVVAQR